MTTPRDTATTPQQQVYNRSSRTPQPPPGWPYNGPKDESLFVSQSESERSSTQDSEDALDWPCICGKGHHMKGEWIRCEILNCRLKWYHLACVSLSVPPPEKWICRQCRGRMRKLSVAKPDPKKKGIAIKVTPKKGQGHRKRWKELSSDEGEEYKRKVDSAREVKILPGKTRSGAGKDAVYSEDESESTETERTPQPKTRRARPKTRSGAGKNAVYSENESGSTENEGTPRQETRNENPKQTNTTSKDSDQLRSYTGWQPAKTPDFSGSPYNSEPSADMVICHSPKQTDTTSKDSNVLESYTGWQPAPTPHITWSPYNPERSADMVIGHNHEHEIVWDSSEDMILPTNSQYGRTPRTPGFGYDYSSASFEDVWTRGPDMTNADAERGTVEDTPASPANDGSRSSEWETITDTDETVRSSDWETVMDSDATPRSSDWETIIDTDETASGNGGSTPKFYLASNSPPVRFPRLTTPKAVSTHPSIARTATEEASRPRTSGPVADTDGDRALMAALRESWVGQRFA